MSRSVSRLLAPLSLLSAWRLWGEVRQRSMPRHLAVIVDGNPPSRPRSRRPRPARRRPLKTGRLRGSRKGGCAEGDHAGDAEGLESVLVWSERAGIPAVSLFLLSADRLTRCWPADLPRLISLVRRHVWCLADLSATSGWQLRAIGRLELVPSELRTALVDAAAETPGGGGMLVQLAIGYGGREEIVEALKRWAARNEDPTAPTLSEGLERLDPADVAPYLYTGDAPAPDLVLRASEGADLPGSVLWHCIHSDLCFLDVFWPEFQETDFLRAVRTFQARLHGGAQS